MAGARVYPTIIVYRGGTKVSVVTRFPTNLPELNPVSLFSQLDTISGANPEGLTVSTHTLKF